ncbi:MAG: class GN sortase [Halioglobus sp.]|nr:class GN sortase [Halioglobus sp.]
MSRQRRSKRWGNGIMLCLLVLALQQLGGAAMIKAKAWLAPVLIELAWVETLQLGDAVVKPWPWADTWPVGRLQSADLDVDLFILEGDSGNALAFGPGRAIPSAELGAGGTTVVGGHRDTHFAFLQRLRKGNRLQLQLPSGEQRDYRVQAIRVVDASRESLSVDTETNALLLVTCYPFDALQAGGPLRYVVTVLPAEERQTLPDDGEPLPGTREEVASSHSVEGDVLETPALFEEQASLPIWF